MSDTAANLVTALIEQLRAELREELLAELRNQQETTAWPEWMGIETAARYLDMSVERIRKLVARRAVPFVQEERGCRIHFSRQSLDNWMRSWTR